MSTPVLRRGPVPWRRLVLTAAGVGVGTTLLGLLLGLLGFGLRIPFLVGLAVAAVALSWLLKRVLDPAEAVPATPWELDDAHPGTRNLDRRVRVLERYLWGVQPAHGMNRAEVQRILARAVAERRPTPTSTTAEPLPAVLRDYLAADPAPALTRRQLRTILEETSRL